MRLPEVIPNHEAALSTTLQWLITCKTAFINGFGGPAGERLLSYQRKTVELSQGVECLFSWDDVEKMVLTRRQWLLMEMVVAENGPAVHDLISAETTERQRYFESLVQIYTRVQADWADTRTRMIVADTNVFEHNEDYWDQVDWAALVGAADARLFVPGVIVRELDKHKRTDRKNTVSDANPEAVRTRARVSTRRLRERFVDVNAAVSLARSGATAELLLDPPRHVPLEDPDAELIDRALALRLFTQKPVTVVTGDGNMQFAASSAGLDVVNIYEAGH